MYNNEDIPRKIPLTDRLIRKNLARALRGQCLLVTIVAAVLGVPTFMLAVNEMRSHRTVRENAATGLLTLLLVAFFLAMYIYLLIRVFRVKKKKITVRKESVVRIEPLNGHMHLAEFWKSRWRSNPVDALHFESGTYIGVRTEARDGVGDEFYLITYANRPSRILDIYRTTEYEHTP